MGSCSFSKLEVEVSVQDKNGKPIGVKSVLRPKAPQPKAPKCPKTFSVKPRAVWRCQRQRGLSRLSTVGIGNVLGLPATPSMEDFPLSQNTSIIIEKVIENADEGVFLPST